MACRAHAEEILCRQPEFADFGIDWQLKFLFVLFWTLLAALPLYADVAPLIPLQHGYAVGDPRVLTQQRLFGLAHGMNLLAEACTREPAYREPLALAYAEWQERQAAAIAASHRDLARYYFAGRALDATRLDIARALRLKEQLSLKPGSTQLHAACDTFAEALHKPRYDLQQQYLLLSLAWRFSEATATQAQVEACRSLLTNSEAERLDQSAQLWRQTFAVGIAQAKATLDEHWEDVQLDGTLDEWTTRAREDGKRRAVAERCGDISQWLLTRKADPDDAFNAEP